ncbi:plant UBX domain-containing protein 7-like [Elaeis guineensis]|uniref:plant UBX domain-containing protein 7-like n=1 Tax=Elaeis guineensis var. tenera TaxID=51953 RepID=UPI003C6DB335
MGSPCDESKNQLISSFLETAVGRPSRPPPSISGLEFNFFATCLESSSNATYWRLEEALELFFARSEGSESSSSSFSSPRVDINPSGWEAEESHGDRYEGEDGDRAPIPVRRETLYGDVSSYRFQNIDEESRSTRIWESNQRGESTSSGFHDNLSSLFREPSALIYHGPFFKAKVDAAFQDRWLLVNLQCIEEFSSHLLNRDLWSNETVAQAIQTKFIFWQMYHDSDEGKKVCTYYNLVSLPAVLIIDPITGQKMHAWSGMIQAEQFLELLLPFMDVGPKEHIALPHKHPRENVETSMHDISGVYPSSLLHHAVVLFDAIHTPQTTRRFTSINIFSLYILYELSLIPMWLKAILISVAVREGSKKRIISNNNEIDTEKDEESSSSSSDCKICTEKDNSSNGKFTYPILAEEPEPEGDRKQLCRLLWSFYCTQFDKGETRPFRFTQAIPGKTKNLDYESNLTFGEAELSDCVLWLTFERRIDVCQD